MICPPKRAKAVSSSVSLKTKAPNPVLNKGAVLPNYGSVKAVVQTGCSKKIDAVPLTEVQKARLRAEAFTRIGPRGLKSIIEAAARPESIQELFNNYPANPKHQSVVTSITKPRQASPLRKAQGRACVIVDMRMPQEFAKLRIKGGWLTSY